MSEIKESALELIGETPILKLNRYSEKKGDYRGNYTWKIRVSESGRFC